MNGTYEMKFVYTDTLVLAESNTPEFSFIRSAADISANFTAPASGNSTAVVVTCSVLAVVLAGSALAIYIAVVKTRPAKNRRR